MTNENQNIPFDAFKDELNERLKKLPRAKQVRFAWLCAVQALPFLSAHDKEKPFYYWSSKKQKHLLAVLRALDTAAAATPPPTPTPPTPTPTPPPTTPTSKALLWY